MRIGYKITLNVAVFLLIALIMVIHMLMMKAESVMDSDPQPLSAATSR